MLHTIYTACPRGHYFRAGRMTPGLVLRMRGTCPVCGDLQITTGVVTPFGPELVQLLAPHRLTNIRSDEVRHTLRNLVEHADVVRVLQRIPRDPAHLSVADVLAALETWLHHRGRPGGVLPEANQEIEILAETNNPDASVSYLAAHRRQPSSSAVAAPSASGVQALIQWGVRFVDVARARIPVWLEACYREIRHLTLR